MVPWGALKEVSLYYKKKKYRKIQPNIPIPIMPDLFYYGPKGVHLRRRHYIKKNQIEPNTPTTLIAKRKIIINTKTKTPLLIRIFSSKISLYSSLFSLCSVR